MAVLDIAYWAICLVLVASGALKVLDPDGFASFVAPLLGDSSGRAVRATRVAQLVGVGEFVLGFVGLAFGGRVVAAVVTATYFVFAVVVYLAIRRSLPTCGCFGSASSAPSGAHLTMNVLSAVGGAVALARATPGIFEGLKGSGRLAIPAVVAVLAIAVLVVVVDTKPVGATFLRRHTHGGIDERSRQRRV